MKNHTDVLIFQTGICGEASQIPMIAEQNLIFCSRLQRKALQKRGNHGRINEGFNEIAPLCGAFLTECR